MRCPVSIIRADDAGVRPTSLDALADWIRAIENRTGLARGSSRVEVRFPDDGVIVSGGAIHEWIRAMSERGPWLPPLIVLAHLSHRAMEASDDGWAVWVGKRCWPYPRSPTVGAWKSMTARSIFIDPPDAGSRAWAIDLALRSTAVAVVVGDGSGLDMAGSRRLQLAAQAGGGLGLLARAPNEITSLSVAATRWVIHASPSPNANPRWMVELARCKGGQCAAVGRTWTVERDEARGLVVVSADVGDGSGHASASRDAVGGRRTA